MIKNHHPWEEFKRNQVRKNKADYFQKLKIFEALYQEAMTLNILPLEDPLEGIEVDIRIAKALNA